METRTIEQDQWYGRDGSRIPNNPFFPTAYTEKVTNNQTYYPNIPRPIFGFVPDAEDTAEEFKIVNDANSPWNINSMFIANPGVPNDSTAFERQGATILATSYYINGTISKPTNLIPANIPLVANQADPRSVYAYENARNNQVLMAIILQDCKGERDVLPIDWTEILDLNTSPTVEPDNRLLANPKDVPAFPGKQTAGVTAVCRFGSPVSTIRFNSRSLYRNIATRLYDFDRTNTLFAIDMYVKLESQPYKGAKYKQKIKITYKSSTKTCLYQDAIKNLIHLNFFTHGLYKEIFQTQALSRTGLPAQTNQQPISSYYDSLSQLYPKVTFTGKFNFKDC